MLHACRCVQIVQCAACVSVFVRAGIPAHAHTRGWLRVRVCVCARVREWCGGRTSWGVCSYGSGAVTVSSGTFTSNSAVAGSSSFFRAMGAGGTSQGGALCIFRSAARASARFAPMWHARLHLCVCAVRMSLVAALAIVAHCTIFQRGPQGKLRQGALRASLCVWECTWVCACVWVGVAEWVGGCLRATISASVRVCTCGRVCVHVSVRSR